MSGEMASGREQAQPDSDAPQPSTSGSQAGQLSKPKKEYRRLEPVTPEQLAQEDLMNNCLVKTIISGVMGSGLGLVFGVFMGAMDSAVSSAATCMHACLGGRRGTSLYILFFLLTLKGKS
jgi:import inner membrane translocase subunit TIM22